MTPEAKYMLTIVEAYGAVLSEAANAMTLLLYLAAAMLSGWTTGLIMDLLGLSVGSVILSIFVFASAFTLATLSSSIVHKIAFVHGLLEIPPERRREQVSAVSKVNKWIWVGWFASSFAAFALSQVVLPPGSRLVMPVAVSLSLSLGMLTTFFSVRITFKKSDSKLLFICLYLLLTLPTYFVLAPAFSDRAMLPYMLLTIHVSISYFAVAVWYLLSARRAASGILLAARGED